MFSSDDWQGLVVPVAFCLDLILGESRRLPHPVQAIGWLIGQVEWLLRRFARSERAERIAGVILAATVVASVYILTSLAITVVSSYSSSFGFMLSAILAYTTLAVRGLADAGRAVLRRLESDDIEGARKELAMIVGRDTMELDEQEVSRAVVETIAENGSDGVIAPLFYLAVGGPALALAYKAVNTLDSMVGYKNERYRHFGWAAARLDDVANYIPARLTGVLLCIAGSLRRVLTPERHANAAAAGFDADESFNSEIPTASSDLTAPWRIMLRDGAKHPSPNSGYPEAAMAGALGIRLGGPSTYGGQPSFKPFLGDAREPVSKDHIRQSITLLYTAALFGALAATSAAIFW